MHHQRSILHRDILLPDFFQRKNPLCPLTRAIKQSLRVTGRRAGVYLLGTVDNVESVALNFRVPCAQCIEHGRESKVQLRCLLQGPALEASVLSSLPQAQQRHQLSISERWRRYLGMDSLSNDWEEVVVQPLRLPLHCAKKCCCKRHPPILR